MAKGRGAAWALDVGDHAAVLRWYCRGGLPAKVSDSAFVFTGLTRSRPWREWGVTQQLWQRGLPVAEPMAAGLRRSGLFYRAALLTRRIPDAHGLGVLLKRGDSVNWAALAQTVAQFHAAGLDHVDLNLDNLLLSGSTWHLIDFDRCRFRQPAAAWRRSNCQRLKRSLLKAGVFDQSAWSIFERAYNASISAR